MMSALRSMWREPRAPDNPGIVWWDWWLVAAVILAALAEVVFREDVTSRPLAFVVAVTLAFSLPWRRVYPLGMVAVTFGAIIVINAFSLSSGDPSFGLYTMAFILLMPYALVRWGSGREIVAGLAIILVGYGTGIAADYTDIGEAIAAMVFALSPALIGASVRYWSYARSRDRDRAVLEEREQIARELHDTVAHHVSAIAIRAQAGQAMATADPNAPLEALAVIEAEASNTLSEMRAMVGALRQGEEPDLTPRLGVADINRLATDDYDRVGVNVNRTGESSDLAPGVDAALYRIAQESVTNAVRHARNATTIVVTVHDLGDSTVLTVTDDGEPTFAQSNPEPGYGLLGMAERAKLLGGTFSAGPGPDRGWVVSAELPNDGVAR
ncbi:MAG: sensor histidine kinase [Acidimicrobiia bacterium]